MCVTVLDMQRQLTDLRPEVLSWLATVPVAERPADAVEVVGSRADDRHMGIPNRDSTALSAAIRGCRWAVGHPIAPHALTSALLTRREARLEA